MQLVEIGTGSGKSLYVIDKNGNCLVKEYLEDLDEISLKQFLRFLN